MKTGICVLGIHKELTNKIAQNLASKLDMFYVDVDALLEYEILNPDYVESHCGKNYLIKLQRSCVKRVVSFENSLLTMNYSLLNDKENLELIKGKCLIIYVELSKGNYIKKLKRLKVEKLKNILNSFIFEDRNKLCLNICDINIDANNKSYLQCANLIKEEIKKYYEDYLK